MSCTVLVCLTSLTFSLSFKLNTAVNATNTCNMFESLTKLLMVSYQMSKIKEVSQDWYHDCTIGQEISVFPKMYSYFQHLNCYYFINFNGMTHI